MMAAVGFALAIVAIAVGTVPVLGAMALIPASIGFVFSIIALVQSRQTYRGKWLAIPGIVLSIAAACWVPVAATMVPWAALTLTQASAAGAGFDDSVAPPPSASARAVTPAPPPPRSQYIPPSMRRHPPTPDDSTTPGVRVNPGVGEQRALEARVAKIVAMATHGFDDTWSDEVASTRNAIDAAENVPDRQKLHATLDDGLMVLVEADAVAVLPLAQDAFIRGAYPEAEGILEALHTRRQAAGPPRTFAAPTTPSVAAAADLQRRISLVNAPEKRFIPRGVVGGSRGVRVSLHDALTGETSVVEEGAALDGGFVVTAIQEDTRQLELTRGHARYLLHW